MNGVQTRFKCKLDVKRCKRFVFPPSSLLPRSNALKTKAIRYFQTDRTLTRIVSPPLDNIDNAAFSVEVLNDLHGMSRTSFYCKLKALTDLSPQELIKSVRLKRAVQLLKEGKHNITEVSELCGFSESKYFRQVFKKEYKMSPSQYAKEYGTSSAIIEDDTSQDDSDK